MMARALWQCGLLSGYNYCNGVTYCDVDLDGDLDVLAYAGNASLPANTVSILINNGDGTSSLSRRSLPGFSAAPGACRCR